MTRVTLVRHGETDWNRERRWQGWADPPLNEVGRRQASELAARLRGTAFDAIYSSDLRRARETALIVAAALELPVVADAGLREIDVGSWSGLTHPEIEERFGGVRPDGETREQHAARVRAAAARILGAHPDGAVVLVTHGGTMRALLGDHEHPIPNCEALHLRWLGDRLVAA